MTTFAHFAARIIVGVDTHKDEHVAVAVDRLGYEGWTGCEYRPAGKTENGLGWARKYL